jgi:hypothetical protein
MDDPAATRVVRPRGVAAVARVVVVAAMLLVVWGAPFARQVLGVTAPGLRGWQMFNTTGLSVTRVRYWQVREDGVWVNLGRPPEAGNVRFQTADLAKKTAQRVCARLGPDADVRLEVKEARQSGWRTVERSKVNRCGS